MKTWIAGLLVLPVAALADTPVDETRDAQPDGSVEIVNVAGSVTITGWDRNEVRVTGELGDDVEELVFKADGDRVYIEVKVDESGDWGWGGGGKDKSADLQISIPAASRLEVETVAAEIEIREVSGRIDAESVSGEVTVATSADYVEAVSVSGDVEVTGSGQTGAFEFSSVSGDVVVKGVSGDVSTASVSGDVEAVLGTIGRGDFESTSGDVEVTAGFRGSDSRVSMETVSGDVDFKIIGDRAGDYEAKTFSGSIRNCFGPEPERKRFGPGESLSFVEGDGGPRIRVSAMSGDVRICDD